MRVFLILFLQLLAAHSFAQEDVRPTKLFERHDPNKVTAVLDTPTTDTASVAQPRPIGDVNIIADPNIARLMELHSEHKHVRSGYRVQVYLGNKRPDEEKRAFLQNFPDVPVYMSWLAPNFRLRVGDLGTRLEAENLLRRLKADYPGSYIVTDEIEMARVKVDR